MDNGEPAEGNDAQQELRCVAARGGVEPDFIGDGRHRFLPGTHCRLQLVRQRLATKGRPLDQSHEHRMRVEVVEVFSHGAGQDLLRRASAVAGPDPARVDGRAHLVHRPLDDGAIERRLAAEAIAGRSTRDSGLRAYISEAGRVVAPARKQLGCRTKDGVARAMGVTLAFGVRHVGSLACCPASMVGPATSVKFGQRLARRTALDGRIQTATIEGPSTPRCTLMIRRWTWPIASSLPIR